MQTYVCTVYTVRSPFRILLVPECFVIKLACTVADNSVSFLSHGWLVLLVKESREGTSFLLCMQQRQLIHSKPTLSLIFTDLQSLLKRTIFVCFKNADTSTMEHAK